MNIETAKQITQRIEKCIELLSEIVQLAHTHCNEAESRAVRRGVGYVLSEMQDRLSDPIFREYPALLPPGVDYTPREGPTFSDLVNRAKG